VKGPGHQRLVLLLDCLGGGGLENARLGSWDEVQGQPQEGVPIELAPALGHPGPGAIEGCHGFGGALRVIHLRRAF
jgi:hypothetical protein